MQNTCWQAEPLVHHLDPIGCAYFDKWRHLICSPVIINLMKVAAEQYEAGGDAYNYATHNSSWTDWNCACITCPCHLHADMKPINQSILELTVFRHSFTGLLHGLAIQQDHKT